MKVFLINPPSPFLINQRAIPPLGILYIAGYLRATGMSGEILDLTGNSAVENSDSWPDADLYGITATTPQYPLAKSIKAILKQRFGSSSDMLIGGPHATSCSTLCQLDGFVGGFFGVADGPKVGYRTGAFGRMALCVFQIEDLD